MTFVRAVLSLSLAIVLAWWCLFAFAQPSEAENFSALRGNGNIRNPYIISGVEDLIIFRDAVNSGNSFKDQCLTLTSDLDLGSFEPWIPIGIFGSDSLFFGVFDGAGHTISNIKSYSADENVSDGGNRSLFGVLQGTVMNLGIESGTFSGANFGTIASHGGEFGKILNCYSYANIDFASRGGGIADNFGSGIIANCAYFGTISNAGMLGNISSYEASFVFKCVANSPLVPSGWRGNLVDCLTDENDSKTIVDFLNSSLADSADLCGIEDDRLVKWALKDGKVKFDA